MLHGVCKIGRLVLKMAAHGATQELTDEDAAVLQFPKGKQRVNSFFFKFDVVIPCPLLLRRYL